MIEIALARLEIVIEDVGTGIDDRLVGGVIDAKYDNYRLDEQWTSYGWNVFALDDGNDYDQILAALHTMESWDPEDRRPMM